MKNIKYYLKKVWRQTHTFILTLLIGKKVRKDNHIRHSFYEIFEPNDIADTIDQPDYLPNICNLGICKIDVRRSNSSINLNIYLTRPGILIGKGGRVIDYVKDRLTKWHKVPVNISITEVNPFRVRL
jgi:hypothetical protein